MRKINKIIPLIFTLLTVCSCSKEKNYFKDTYDVDTTISFDQLLDIAEESENSNGYTVKYSGLGSSYDSYEAIRCLGSEVYCCRDIATDSHCIKRINETKPLAVNLVSGMFYDNGTNLSSTIFDDLVVYNRSYPVFIYATTTNNGNYQIFYADCYGKILKQEAASSNQEIRFEVVSNNYFYFKVDFSFTYFHYTLVDHRYVVSVVNKEECTSATNIEENSMNPLYDKDGEIFGYESLLYNSVWYLYDKNKKFLNSISLSSFGLASYDVVLGFEKKACFFKSEIYYENINEKSSKESYKCKCLEINLSNGEVSFDNDFKYLITSSSTVYQGNKYAYTYFTYYELNSKREKGDVELCSIARENLSFNNPFVYDGFKGEVGKIDKDTVFCVFYDGLFICTKKERKCIPNITKVELVSNDKVMFKYIDGKYYVCDKKNLVNAIDNGINNNAAFTKYDKISDLKFYGDYIKLNFNEETNKYSVNGLTIEGNFISMINYGLIVTETGISSIKESFYTCPSGTKIQSIEIVFEFNSYKSVKSVFKVGLSSGTDQYFSLELAKA